MSPTQPVGPAKRRETNALLNMARQNAVLACPGAQVSTWANGTLVYGAPQRRAPITRGASAPFRLSGAIETGPVAKIYVTPGMVNNFIPTISVGGTPTSLVAVPAPGLVVTGPSGVVHLEATVDAAGSITALTVKSATSIPPDTSTLKHKLVGTWTSSGGVFTSVTSILNTNQTFRMCNGAAEWY